MSPTTCDRQRLARSLDERLDEAEEEALARHLAECPSCRAELERLVGQPADIARICAALKGESRGGGETPSTADFAVDFLAPSPSPEAIGRLGEIDILEVIGHGGMGIVLKGYQSELKRMVAVKVLAPHLAASGGARRRFAREAQAAAAILHPNVMPILTVHSDGKLPYLVMPFLAGESLQQRLARQGPLELVDILRIAIQVARGLSAAHAQGIVHRDIKPANILLERGVDRVMLTDFGLARAIDDASITRSGLIAGTPQYMSPEQIRGESVEARSDLFSLGSVLYAMCAGRPPFRAESTYGILRRITDEAPRRLAEINAAIPHWLAAIVDKLLAKEASNRYASASEVADLLEECLAHVQQPTVVPLPRQCQPARPRQGKQGVVLGAVVVGLLGLVTIGLAQVFRGDGQGVAAPAERDAERDAMEEAPSWQAVDRDLERIQNDASRIEAQVDQFWDRPTEDLSETNSSGKEP